MNLNQFFAHIKEAHWMSQHSVIAFKGANSYPLLFFSLLCSRFKESGSTMVEIIDVSGQENSHTLAALQTSFLGMPTFYWLKNLSELDEKKRTFWIHYLSSYQGPNTVAFFINEATSFQVKHDHLEVSISDVIDQQSFINLTSFFCVKTPIASASIKRIFVHHDTIPLDTACLLMQYAIVLGGNMDLFVCQWLDKIVTPERSLFTLSAALFAKKSEPFFKLWSGIHDDYADVFWVAFWSEQLWRAHHFVALSQLKQFEQAKKIGARLPFSFLQRDWKLHKPERLKAAHDAIYAIDCSLKNGGSAISLDLFYSKFFAQK